MSGNSNLLDTNIVLYLLAGDQVLANILGTKRPYVSFITEMELFGNMRLSAEEEKQIHLFLSDCFIIENEPANKADSYTNQKKRRT